MPGSGDVVWYTAPGPDLAPFDVNAPAEGPRLHAIRLADWNTGRLVALVTIRSGESARVKVPLGEYQLTLAAGDHWYGPEKLFGRSGGERKTTAPMRFYRNGQEVVGNTIDLRNRVDGNLHTRPVVAFE